MIFRKPFMKTPPRVGNFIYCKANLLHTKSLLSNLESRLFSSITQEIYKCNLEHQDQWHAYEKPFMPCLVPQQKHPQEQACSAAQNGTKQQSSFRYSPDISPCAKLIYAAKQQCHHIDLQKIDLPECHRIYGAIMAKAIWAITSVAASL